MSEAERQQEPSMEEILASIRRIISEEGDGEEAASKPAPRPAPAPPPPAEEVVVQDRAAPALPPEDDSDEEVLELTDMVDDDGTLVDLARPQDQEEDPIDAVLGDEPLLPPEPRHAADPDEEEAILSDHAAAAAAGSLAALTTAAGRRIADQLGAPDIGGVTVEELVRQLLRPMLRDWLDEHLPPMVERMVRREIERLAAQGRR
jgi:cell pole-organizing protein PopZ